MNLLWLHSTNNVFQVFSVPPYMACGNHKQQLSSYYSSLNIESLEYMTYSCQINRSTWASDLCSFLKVTIILAVSLVKGFFAQPVTLGGHPCPGRSAGPSSLQPDYGLNRALWDVILDPNPALNFSFCDVGYLLESLWDHKQICCIYAKNTWHTVGLHLD